MNDEWDDRANSTTLYAWMLPSRFPRRKRDNGVGGKSLLIKGNSYGSRGLLGGRLSTGVRPGKEEFSSGWLVSLRGAGAGGSGKNRRFECIPGPDSSPL